MTRKTVLERLIDGSIEDTSGCLLWQGSLVYGYGKISINNKSERTHRVMWTEINGDIPESLYVLHSCDVRNCVNPKHLFLGTHQDNMSDMKYKGRASKHMLGGKHTEEARQKMSSAKLGKKQHPEVVAKKTGLKRSEETRQKISLANRGRKITNETKNKISLSNKGMPKSEAHKEALKKAWVNRRLKEAA